ncbi:prolipoprotein diacylglyceryl transferase [Nocardia vaccinii]|uniref:prolipoprotein diacylglyceryl transferase n=1 Tax=Nocardia vaccinii TaxID=1822 RepID=UPI0008343917|nr:prolipoprotein diacylglyceryl transferase [Nocardia vaccinii]
MTYRVLAESVVANSALHGSVLAYIPSPPRGVWNLGPLPLRAYAVCIIIGIIAAIWWGERRWQQRGGRAGAVLDVAMFAVPFGLVGGRLYHVCTDWYRYFDTGKNPWDALKVWDGGLGIWGAVLLGGVGAWIGCRVYRIPLPAFGDAIAPGILLAQAIGRLGNYFNQELYGHDTTKPWGLEIYLRFDHNGQLDMMNGVSTGVVQRIVQPTFLYELVWNLIGVVLLILADRRWRIGHGRLFALYVAIYTFGRFWVELLRDDDATHIFGIRINSFTSTIVFVCAIAYFVLATKGREAAATLQPGGDRPWPWQFGALREHAAQSAATEADSALTTNADDTEAAGADAEDRAPDEDAGKSDASSREAEQAEPGESGADERTSGSENEAAGDEESTVSATAESSGTAAKSAE